MKRKFSCALRSVCCLALVLTMLLGMLPMVLAGDIKIGLEDKLVLRYDFSGLETDEITIADKSGNGKNATIDGNVTVSGGVATLSGGAIKLPDNLLNGLDAVTVTTWVKRNKMTYDSRLFDIGNDQNNYFQFSPNSAWSQIISEVKIGGNLNNAVNKDQAGSPFLNQSGFPDVGTWAFVAVTWGDGNLKIYVDGELHGSKSLTGKPSDLANMTNSWIGKGQFPDAALEADIKDFRVYGTVLSAANVKLMSENKEPTSVGLADDLVLHYTFDSVESNVIQDASGNNKNATIDGSVTVSGGVATLSGGAIKLPDNLLNGLDAVTVTTWVKRVEAQDDAALFDIGSSQTNFFKFVPNSAWSQIISEIKINGAQSAAVNKDSAGSPYLKQSGFPEAGTWAFVAVTWGAGNLKIYVDGELLGSKSLTGKPSNLANMTNSWIGKSQYYPNDPNLKADIKDFRVYGTMLSADNVKRMANGNEPVEASTVTPSQTTPEAIPDGHLVASYDFNELEADGKTIADKSGNNRNAMINGLVTVNQIANLTGGYIELPDNLLNGLDEVSVSAWINRDEIQNDARLFDIGNDQDNYFQFAPNTAWSQIISEVKIRSNLKKAVNKDMATSPYLKQSGFPDCGTWAFVTVTWGNGKLKIYVDGKLLGFTSLSDKPSDLANMTNAYIGKSQYSDPNLLAKVENFQIHDIVLTEGQILTLMQEENDNDKLDLISAIGELEIAEDVYEDLTLPTASSDEKVQFTWKSSSPADLTDAGKLADGHESGEYSVTLTVTATQAVESGEAEMLTHQFKLKVHYLTDADRVANAKKNLGLVTLVDADSLYLPTTVDGVTITWSTSDPSVIEVDGTVHRAEVGGGNKYCTLTATLQCGDETDTKVFENRLVMEKYAAYLLTYFGGDELATNVEQTYATVHFAYSKDGLHWTPLKGNETIVAATIKGSENPNLYGSDRANECLARDPMVYRQQDGKLRLMSSHSWNNPSIYVWDAGDLCSFSGERILRVNMLSNGNAWAPECTYDPVKEKYMIIYTDPNGRSVGGSCGWGTYTTDFTQENLVEEECNIPLMCTDEIAFYPYIDCSMYSDITTGKYYMTYARCDTNYVQGIYIAEASKLGSDTFSPINNNDYLSPYECEGPFMIKALNEERYYVYYDFFWRGGQFGCSTTDDLDSNNWRIMDSSEFEMPDGVRHGNAIPITQGELDKLIATYGISVESVAAPAAVTSTYEKYANKLPKTVEVTLEDGSKKDVAVTWDTSKVTDELKSFTLTGTLSKTAGVYEEDLFTATMTLTLVEAVPHEHNWNEVWSSDENYHWHECTEDDCDVTENSEKSGYGAHENTEIRGATAATYDAEGYTGDTWCLDCTTRIATGTVIPKLTRPSAVPAGTPAQQPFNQNASASSGSFPFLDVPVNSWFYSSIKSAWEKGLIDGVNATQFNPNANLTVAQAIKLAAALHQLSNTGAVTLSNGNPWYSTYLEYAIANGILDAKYRSCTEEELNAAATRGEFVHILHGAMSDYAAKNSVADNAIPDVKTTDEYGTEVYTFYRAGILTGSDANGTFYGENSIKRSEVAAILVRMYDASARQSIILN